MLCLLRVFLSTTPTNSDQNNDNSLPQMSVSSGVLLMGAPLPVAWLWFCMIQLQVCLEYPYKSLLLAAHSSSIGDERPLWLPLPSSLLTRVPRLPSPQVSFQNLRIRALPLTIDSQQVSHQLWLVRHMGLDS